MADEQLRRSMFVDFMYAIVVGSALPLLNSEHLNLSDVRFWGILFLLLVVLEDYFLYETQIAPFQQPGKISPIALFLEVAILVTWYFSALALSAKENRTTWFVAAFGLFYLLKFSAGVAHWTGFYKALHPSEKFHRNLGRGIWGIIGNKFCVLGCDLNSYWSDHHKEQRSSIELAVAHKFIHRFAHHVDNMVDERPMDKSEYSYAYIASRYSGYTVRPDTISRYENHATMSMDARKWRPS